MTSKDFYLSLNSAFVNNSAKATTIITIIQVIYHYESCILWNCNGTEKSLGCRDGGIVLAKSILLWLTYRASAELRPIGLLQALAANLRHLSVWCTLWLGNILPIFHQSFDEQEKKHGNQICLLYTAV